MSLKIRLKPGEKFMVNGAVMSAGKDGAQLVVHNKTTLLRESEIMHEDEANTPSKHIYFTIMLLYIGGADHDKIFDQYQHFMLDLLDTTHIGEIKKALTLIHNDVMSGEYYRALKTCKAVIALEEELLHASEKAEATG